MGGSPERDQGLGHFFRQQVRGHAFGVANTAGKATVRRQRRVKAMQVANKSSHCANQDADDHIRAVVSPV
jgi:hypothetical protein